MKKPISYVIRKIATSLHQWTPQDLQPKHTGVAALIYNDQKQILVQNHVKLGLYTIPVGKVEQGQSPENAVKSEVFEETGLIINSMDQIAEKDFSYIRNNMPVTVHVHVYKVSNYSGTLENKEPHKHREQKFMSISTLKALNLSDNTLLALKSIGEI